MLVGWFEGFILLFVMHYIMILAIQLNSAALDLLNKAKLALVNSQIEQIQNSLKNTENELFQNRKSLQQQLSGLEEYLELTEQKLVLGVAQTSTLETAMRVKMIFSIINGSAGEKVTNLILFCMLVYYTIKFCFIYGKRMLTVGFLIAISPLVTITYAIDKAGDGKAQAFQTLMREFLINVFIQPIHALLFMIFIFTALFLSDKAPLLAIMFFAVLSRGEKITRNIIFQKMSGSSILGNMEDVMSIKKFK